MEKLIIFDWGGVIESHYVGENNIFEAILRIVKKLGCPYEDKVIKKKNFYNITQEPIGTISDIKKIEEWYLNVKEEFLLQGTFEDFIKVYEQEFFKVDYYQDVINIIDSLQGKCKLGVLSNLMLLDKKRLDYQVNLSRMDYVWLSFELGCEKPQKEIYQRVLNDVGTEANDVLFIDDNKRNIEAAKKAGIKTIHANGREIEKKKKGIADFFARNQVG